MILDVVTCFIILLFMFLGFKQGFFKSFLGIIGWIISFAMTFVWIKPYTNLVKEKTNIYEMIFSNLEKKIDTDEYLANLFSLPDSISKDINSATTSVINSFLENLTDTFFGIICFISLFILIKIILWSAFSLLTLASKSGPLRIPDALLGMLLGFFKGVACVFIFFALVAPLASLSNEKVRNFINSDLESSTIANQIYSKNFLISFAKYINKSKSELSDALDNNSLTDLN